MVGNPVTYEQLDQVLRQLGFISRKAEPRLQHYEHALSDTTIILGDRRPTESVLPSELVSARRHLIEKGHVGARGTGANALSEVASPENHFQLPDGKMKRHRFPAPHQRFAPSPRGSRST